MSAVLAGVILGRKIAPNLRIGKKPPRLIQSVKGLIRPKTQVGRIFQRQIGGHPAAQFGLVARQRGNCILDADRAHERHDIDCRHLQIGRARHFAHGDRHRVQCRIVDLGPVEDTGKGPADKLTDAQLPLRLAIARIETLA